MRSLSQLNRKEVYLLHSVPLRGTTEWDLRERLRMSLGACCLSFGSIEEQPDNGKALGWRISNERNR